MSYTIDIKTINIAEKLEEINYDNDIELTRLARCGMFALYNTIAYGAIDTSAQRILDKCNYKYSPIICINYYNRAHKPFTRRMPYILNCHPRYMKKPNDDTLLLSIYRDRDFGGIRNALIIDILFYKIIHLKRIKDPVWKSYVSPASFYTYFKKMLQLIKYEWPINIDLWPAMNELCPLNLHTRICLVQSKYRIHKYSKPKKRLCEEIRAFPGLGGIHTMMGIDVLKAKSDFTDLCKIQSLK
jgi:hypothetical protein